ncbi:MULTISPECIES: Ig-like domain-containing protein [unclassified Streptomyces]|uniref:L,D-transpeptidase n=1 Tax=unclassified Streptomyces TaxID=2593676 RepID=UPI002251114A|nr:MULTISPECIES: Ig-like domain-containing protein [unclassified Streptomyces]MCX5139757.1 Ig-like domain-containing protein [Streptomyces sp. NBC_00338]WRZ64411.1 Ig-like domain-containing protein [Streptomyces sp. NBC_01257]
MNHTPRIRPVVSCTLLAATLVAGAAACGESGSHPLSAQPYDAADEISSNASDGAEKVDPDKPLEVSVDSDDGRITDVTAVDTEGRHLAGELDADGHRWRSTAPLAAGTRYTVKVSMEDDDGAPGSRTLSFSTAAAKKFLKVTFGPQAGTYGVGQPVTAQLSAPVTDKASRATVERALRVRSTPAVTGSWYWVDDKTLHYRPKDYWPAKASIEVSSNLTGIKVTNALYGAPAKALKITTGDRIEAITDASEHSMTVLRNGEVINTIPVTTGKPGFSTRNGVKVVLGKEYYVRMRGESIGIAEGSEDSYDLPVYYATRVTWSGEYVHAAPWSTGSQGSANVSHGCTGMSTSEAEWFFNTVREGDIVKVVGSEGETMTPFDNGYGDWNLSWAKWQKGSALNNDATPDRVDTVRAARLRPQV